MWDPDDSLMPRNKTGESGQLQSDMGAPETRPRDQRNRRDASSCEPAGSELWLGEIAIQFAPLVLTLILTRQN